MRRDEPFFRDVNQGRRPFSEAEREHLVRLFDGNLAFADQEIGALRRAMEADGLWEKTVVIVAADHGEELSSAAGSATTSTSTSRACTCR